MTRSIIYSIDGSWRIDDRRSAEDEGSLLIARSSRVCERLILGYADEEEQRNAALGIGDRTATEIAAYISARRAEHAARKAAIRAVLDSAEIDNAEKLAALDAL